MGRSLRREDVEPLLRGRFGKPYAFVERCASTQRLLGGDAPEGAVVATDEQTEGRGRLGRRWEAPAGSSVLFSLLLRPPVETARWPELTVVAGRAVADAISDVTGLETSVKHPNDVLVEGRKVAGVLAEATEGRVVLGVGVNVSQGAGELPAGARMPPTSLDLETGSAVDRTALFVQILYRLEVQYVSWIQTP
jgi:BirA family transcriptional regulator, biotin operon repressor / biotin---[acetyl-CoA-carboxylase] ligase